MIYLSLFISAFISATLFPLGSEALLLYDFSLGANVYLLLIFATVGNTLGSVLNYYFGLKGEEYLLEKKMIKQEKIIKIQNIFNKYGGYSLLLSWVPLIGDPITFIAGLSQYNFKKFLVLVFIAKAGRYIFLALVYFVL